MDCPNCGLPYERLVEQGGSHTKFRVYLCPECGLSFRTIEFLDYSWHFLVVNPDESVETWDAFVTRELKSELNNQAPHIDDRMRRILLADVKMKVGIRSDLVLPPLSSRAAISVRKTPSISVRALIREEIERHLARHMANA